MKPPSMVDDLADEIQRDIAERYFGFRKLIEEDKQDLADRIKQYSFILEKRISFDLIRIYILLKEEALTLAFLDLIGLEEGLFYDPYLVESEGIRKRVFEGVRGEGLTRYSCFHNLVKDSYERLTFHVDMYREKFEELMELQEAISEEVKAFYRQNDLGSIMGFLRNLSDPSISSGMEGGMEIGMVDKLDHALHIDVPLPIEHYLPMIPPLLPFSHIRREMNRLIKQAYPLHDQEFLAGITQAVWKGWR